MMETMIVAADEDALSEVNDFLDEKLEGIACSSKARFQIELAVEEIFVNLASYAYEEESTKDSCLYRKVEVGCEAEPEKITICFMDSGTPFDPLQRERADTSGKMFMERVGGFGIHLVRETMDDVAYEYRDGKNILTIVKILH